MLRFISHSIVALLLAVSCMSFSLQNHVTVTSTGHTRLSMSSQPLDPRTKEKLEMLVNTNKVLLFMKGNKLFPQCGFSNTACRQNLMQIFTSFNHSNMYLFTCSLGS